MKKLTDVTIQVPFKSAGNVIRQQEVTFEVFQDTELYSIKPKLTEAERRLANLPESLEFHLLNSKPVSKRGQTDGNQHVIQDAVNVLKAQRLIA